MNTHTASARGDLVAADDLNPPYAPMVEACARFHISRTMAYRFEREGLIDTFRIGRRVFVMLPSLETLAARLRAAQLQARRTHAP